MEKYLITAGGRITCLRCTAKSTRSGNQCLKPALNTSRTSKCGFHGAKSTGAKTEAGKARAAAANFKTGEYTKVAIAQRSKKLAQLRQLEDVCNLLGLTNGSKTTGPKPAAYKQIKTLKEAWEFALDMETNKQ
jgi:hypothetical protein